MIIKSSSFRLLNNINSIKVYKINQYMSLFSFFKKSDEPQQKPKPVQPFYQSQQQSLPQNFAQTVMDLQMQMQFIESCDLEVVQQLNELYRMAIQFYVTIDSKKAEHFHRKLTSLLTNPNTIDVIEQKKMSVKTAHLDPVMYSKNLKQQLSKFNSQSQVVVKSMIEGNAKKMQQHNRLISEDIETQQTRLKRRLEERSKSKKKL